MRGRNFGDFDAADADDAKAASIETRERRNDGATTSHVTLSSLLCCVDSPPGRLGARYRSIMAGAIHQSGDDCRLKDCLTI